MKGESHKAQRLTNFIDNKEVYDTLHHKCSEVGVCKETACNGSLMNIRKMGSALRGQDELLDQAKTFLDEYYASVKGCGGDEHQARWKEVQTQVMTRGTYHLTSQELEFGAKLAWRNAPRCIGRIQWSKLKLFDARHVTTPQEMYDVLCDHIKYATDGGNIRSCITVFPERRTGFRDFRVWNQQLICYAGYANPDGSVTGDPAYVKFTKICQELGWRGSGGRFDVLPLVLSTATCEPQWFEIPKDIVLEVNFEHPEYKWFKDLELKWFALPAVSSMMFDCGGIQFPAAPFNGWYMSTEIASRDLCDNQRYNILQTVAEKMGLNTRSNVTLWKDKTGLEVNKAVLHSFQEAKVTLVDHHTAADTFMQFMENEYRQRGGCPADWVWIVPPVSGSLTPVFHQEMSLYYLKPAYEYQEPGWITHPRQTRALMGEQDDTSPFRRLLKKVMIGVFFASTLYSNALAKRVKITILYATETGKSQLYAHYLSNIFKRRFNPSVRCMDEYEVNRENLRNESLLLLLASTTGAGEPPENGEKFVKSIFSLRREDDMTGQQGLTFMQHYNGYKDKDSSKVQEENMNNNVGKKAGRWTGLSKTLRRRLARERISFHTREGIQTPDFKFSVFALGSSNYKYFCNFGYYLDHVLQEAGGRGILPITCGNELDNQEQAFQTWGNQVFKAAAELFGEEVEERELLKLEDLTADNVKVLPAKHSQSIIEGLSTVHGKKIQTFRVAETKIMHEEANRWSQFLSLKSPKGVGPDYLPGDHVGVLPPNNSDLVASILSRLNSCNHSDDPVQLHIQRWKGAEEEDSWAKHPTLPETSIRVMLSRYLDINTPPTVAFIRLLAAHASNSSQVERLKLLATDEEQYSQWRSSHYPNLLEVLEEFSSVQIPAKVLVCALPLLQPRYYSISSSLDHQPGQIHLTIAGVQYKTQGGTGAVHQGVATGFLRKVSQGNRIQMFHKSAPGFHLPSDLQVPVMMIGAGSGIAPFRGFWQQHHYNRLQQKETKGGLTLFFGCRNHAEDLYAEEKSTMVRSGTLSGVHLALSRNPKIPKTYVQDMLLVHGMDVSRHILEEGGHIYVCGSQALADDVCHTIKLILQEHGLLSEEKATDAISQLKEENRYHEDVFGIRVQE